MSVPSSAAPLPRKRRGVELFMIVFAIVVALGAYVIVGLTQDGKVPASLLGYGLGLGALAAIAHITVRMTAPYADPVLLPIAIFLNGFGLVMIHRLDPSIIQHAKHIKAGLSKSQQANYSIPGAAAPHQLIWTTIAIALFVAVLVLIREPRMLSRYMYTLGALGLIFMALPALLPASISSVNGEKLWIRLPGFSIQPGEFAKLALLVFFAAYLGAKRDVLSLAGRRLLFIDLPRARDLGPILVAWAASLLILVFEHDLGTSLLFFGMFIAVLYVATQRTSWLLIGLLLFAGGAFGAAQLISHVHERVEIWLHPWQYAATSSYQLVQGLFSLASGGILGTGLGQGRPELVPFANTDFIMTSFGEEIGLTGLMALLMLYVLFVERGMRTAVASRDPFVKLFACGLAFSIALQVFVVVGGVTRLIPLTGLTTPFLSYGGSSLLANWIIVALLIRMSDNARRPSPQAAQDEGMTQVVSTR